MRDQLKLPIGIEDFADIRELGFYYVDKTGLIKELLNNWGRVNLFTRPRRFGKTLNMSMFRNFFEAGVEQTLFEGLEIAKDSTLCEKYMGKFPVIFISLKGIDGDSYETARAMMCAEIAREAGHFQFLFDSDRLTEYDKQRYRELLSPENPPEAMPDSVLMNSFLTLSMLLHKHYERKVIILIDEYDVPLDKAFDKGYYEKMVLLIKNVFQQALKTNDSLQLAILTGCLRISKESIFTGLNNFNVISITNTQYAEYFGFTDDEVRDMLQYYGLTEHYENMKLWYDGYRFGRTDVYCPWDVICYCAALRGNPKAAPEAYWINTSSNSIVRRLLQKANRSTQRDIEQLVAGDTVIKKIRQELTYSELDSTIENLWSVLFTTGYLTCREMRADGKYELAIPNLEVREIFVSQIQTWFEEITLQDPHRVNAFCNAFKNGDEEAAEKQLNAYLMQTISIRDTFVRKEKKENFYHGILLGLLSYEENWLISSNAEAGEGYSDILIEIEEERIGIVIEVKYAEVGDFDSACALAMKQIEDKKYAEKLQFDGMDTVFAYGVACYKKKCRIMRDIV